MTYRNNFNSTLGNLGGDRQSLEERSLLGTHTSILGGNSDIQRGNSTGPSGSLDLVGKKKVADLAQVLLSEDKTNVLPDAWEQPKLFIMQ